MLVSLFDGILHDVIDFVPVPHFCVLPMAGTQETVKKK